MKRIGIAVIAGVGYMAVALLAFCMFVLLMGALHVLTEWFLGLSEDTARLTLVALLALGFGAGFTWGMNQTGDGK